MKIDANKLRLAMAANCFNTSDLAAASGVSVATIKRLCYDAAAAARPATVGKIARALNVPVEDIISKELV